jgi:hypothetical protein
VARYGLKTILMVKAPRLVLAYQLTIELQIEIKHLYTRRK